MEFPVGVRSFENNSIDYSWSIDCIDSPDREMQIARLYDYRSYRMVYGIEAAKVGRQIKVVKVGRQFGISSVVKFRRQIGISSVWTCQTAFFSWYGRIRHSRGCERRMWRRGWNCEWGWWRNGRGRPAQTEGRGKKMVVSKSTVGEPVRKQWKNPPEGMLGTHRRTCTRRHFAFWPIWSEGGACTSWNSRRGDASSITGVLPFLTFLSITLSKGLFTK